jgi:molybdopterin-guanine dinucleotide biosynthesis protein A
VALAAGRDEGRIAAIGAALLAGGASSRMGRDKARLELGGVANATRLARLLEGLFEELLLVGGDPPADAPGRRVADPEGPVCALRGLVAALEAAQAPRLLVVATDLPLLTPDLVLALVAWPEADAVVPRGASGVHPLCAIYRREALLPLARERLAAGRLDLRGLLDAVATSYLEPDDLARVDPTGRALTNVNTPEDLARAEALLGGAQRATSPDRKLPTPSS